MDNGTLRKRNSCQHGQLETDLWLQEYCLQQICYMVSLLTILAMVLKFFHLSIKFSNISVRLKRICQETYIVIDINMLKNFLQQQAVLQEFSSSSSSHFSVVMLDKSMRRTPSSVIGFGFTVWQTLHMGIERNLWCIDMDERLSG